MHPDNDQVSLAEAIYHLQLQCLGSNIDLSTCQKTMRSRKGHNPTGCRLMRGMQKQLIHAN